MICVTVCLCRFSNSYTHLDGCQAPWQLLGKGKVRKQLWSSAAWIPRHEADRLSAFHVASLWKEMVRCLASLASPRSATVWRKNMVAGCRHSLKIIRQPYSIWTRAGPEMVFCQVLDQEEDAQWCGYAWIQFKAPLVPQTKSSRPT